MAADKLIAEGPGFGDLPLLYIHGAEDQLVPPDSARPVVGRLAGPNSEWHVVPDARHEVFNELDRESTIDLVAAFAERVTARLKRSTSRHAGQLHSYCLMPSISSSSGR